LEGKRGHTVRKIAGGELAVDEEHANSFHVAMMERRKARMRNGDGNGSIEESSDEGVGSV